jgi:hypothetical protein
MPPARPVGSGRCPVNTGLAAALVAALMAAGSVSLTAEGAAVRRDIGEVRAPAGSAFSRPAG